MILFVEDLNGNRSHYRVNSLEDLHSLFSKFPMAHEAAMQGSDLKEAVENVANYLSEHHLDSWVEGNDISKSVKGKAAALGLALATAMSPNNITAAPTPISPDHKLEQKKLSDNFGSHRVDRFLWNIKQNESSGKADVVHPVIQYGVSKGQRAMGRWGLTRYTVEEMINRLKMKGSLPPALTPLESMNRDETEAFFKKNPQQELDIARTVAEHVLQRNKGDTRRAAYAWNMGHNIFPHNVTDEQLDNHDYVQKYVKADKVNPLKQAATVTKSQVVFKNEIDFKARLDIWLGKRNKKNNELMPNSSNHTPDPGRLREKELDEMKASSQLNPLERMKQNIKNANKRNS